MIGRLFSFSARALLLVACFASPFDAGAQALSKIGFGSALPAAGSFVAGDVWIYTGDGPRLGWRRNASGAWVEINPASIEIDPNAVSAFVISDGTDNWLHFNTNTPLITVGSTADNPPINILGSGGVGVGGDYGISGQYLQSNGPGAALSWATPPAAFDPEAISLADNTSGALRAVEGSNDYLRVNTSNGTESIILGNATTNPSFSLLGTGALLWNASRQITLPDNTANVFRLMEGSNEYFGLATSNGTEAIRFGNTTTNPSVTFSGSGALTLPTGGVSIPDNSATSFRLLEGANSYLTVNTTDASERIVLGNATTNPVFEFAGSGHVAMAGNIVVGDFSVLPSGTGGIRIGSKSSGTDTGNNNIVIGASTGNNAGSRFVSISAGGRTGNASTDSITIQSIGGAGATGTRAIAIGGAATAAGGDAVALGYAASAGQNYSICLGRGATPNAANQFVVGGDGHPTTQFFLGEGVTESGGFVATDVTIQPTEGTGTNRDGLPLTLYGGRGTGTGNAGPTNGSLTLATYPAIGSGTTQHTATPRVRVRADGTVLMGSHNTMSTAAQRDEVIHRQTGYSALPDTSTTYTILTVAPENTATDMVYRMHGSVVGWHYDDGGAPVIVERFFSVVFRSISGSLSFVSYYAHGGGTPQTEVGSTSIPGWLQITGATIQIKHTTAGSWPGGRMVASVEWHGVVYDPEA